MHVAVLGAGVVGVTTAHYLAEAGHDVTVVEKQSGVAEECSYANGAQLSYSFTDSMASPSFVLRMPGFVLGTDSAIRFRPPICNNSGFSKDCPTSGCNGIKRRSFDERSKKATYFVGRAILIRRRLF